jgi:hypothetical protein
MKISFQDPLYHGKRNAFVYKYRFNMCAIEVPDFSDVFLKCL